MDAQGTDNEAIAYCSQCEWTFATDLSPAVKIARMMTVMHVLTKHPKVYAETVGRDPEEAAYEYREILANTDVQNAI